MKKILLPLLLILTVVATSYAQKKDNPWTSVAPAALEMSINELEAQFDDHFLTFNLDLNQMKAALSKATKRDDYRYSDNIISLPLPNGKLIDFKVKENSVFSAGLAAKFPEIKNYDGVAVNDEPYRMKCGYYEGRFYGIIKGPEGTSYIVKVEEENDQVYVVFKDRDVEHEHVACGVEDDLHIGDPLGGTHVDDKTIPSNRKALARMGDPVLLKKYRLAVATTGEFGRKNGLNKDQVLSRMADLLARLNFIYEYELAVTFELIPNNEIIVYMDGETDPYDNQGLGRGILAQNPAVLDSVIGNENFDVGHVLTDICTDGIAGVAALASACDNVRKGSGVTCGSIVSPAARQVIVSRVLAHEVGHQFAASHTFNNCPVGVGGNARASGTAYEPGSGSTIMSYAGTCGAANNVAADNDPYFHLASLIQMNNFIENGVGGSCPEMIMTSSTSPDITIPIANGFFIPISTPFKLTAEGVDAENDEITYCWEQYDLGPAAEPCTFFSRGPLFRSYLPTTDPTRIFPRLSKVIDNTNPAIQECLPTETRDMTFRCTVRDNNDEGGGTNWAEVSFRVNGNAGPFLVQSPNTGSEAWEAGDYVEVTWDVANTDAAPVNCRKVNILLSTDGGNPPYVTLAEGAINDGSHFVAVPDEQTTRARVIIEAADNIFFDMSNQNFRINPASKPTVYFNVDPYQQLACIPDAPTVNLTVDPIDGYSNMLMISAENLPAGVVANFGTNPFDPNTGTTIELDISAANQTGDFPINFVLTGMDLDTLRRESLLSFVSSDFSEFVPTGPVDGATGVAELPTFTWETNANVETTTIEIATTPLFGASIVESASGLTATSYTPSITLEKNTPYYWRIRPANTCGEGEFKSVFGFQTETQSCATLNATADLPLEISRTGTPTLTSKLTVAAGGSISDLNVVNLKGEHDIIRYLDATLISPQATRVVLFSEIRCGSSFLDIGLDDQAADEIPCPANSGQAHLPNGMLSDFNNENSAGEWTLEVTVNNDLGNGGRIESWGLEICSNVNLTGPTLINNLSLEVPPGETNPIEEVLLLAEDADNTAEELIFTVIEAPAYGTLKRAGVSLEVGDKFSQLTIDAGNLTYSNDIDQMQTEDSFSFTVEDDNNGWLKDRFSIVIDPNATVSIKPVIDESTVSVFPNPATDLLNVKFDAAPRSGLTWRIVDIQGRQLMTSREQFNGQLLDINTSRLSSGIYFLELNWEAASIVKKVTIQR